MNKYKIYYKGNELDTIMAKDLDSVLDKIQNEMQVEVD
jgi:hypothetical protein